MLVAREPLRHRQSVVSCLVCIQGQRSVPSRHICLCISMDSLADIWYGLVSVSAQSKPLHGAGVASACGTHCARPMRSLRQFPVTQSITDCSLFHSYTRSPRNVLRNAIPLTMIRPSASSSAWKGQMNFQEIRYCEGVLWIPLHNFHLG